jgi:hypothetical protein
MQELNKLAMSFQWPQVPIVMTHTATSGTKLNGLWMTSEHASQLRAYLGKLQAEGIAATR